MQLRMFRVEWLTRFAMARRVMSSRRWLSIHFGGSADGRVSSTKDFGWPLD